MATNQAYTQIGYGIGGGANPAASKALQLYRSARFGAWLNHAWSQLTGRATSLIDLKEVRVTHTVRGSHYAGIHTVPIEQIRGSEGRCQDFDALFQPTTSHNRGRWLGIATAWQKGATLPPVELVQVGEAYFVRDGHHRISVARAMGNTYVDAEVTVLEVDARPQPVFDLATQRI